MDAAADSRPARKGPFGLPFGLPRLRLPALPPLPALGMPRLTRPRAKRNSNFASTTVAITDTVLSVPSAPPAPSSGGAAAPKVALKPATDVLAGALARAASQSTIHPLDTLKVRLQTRAASASSLGVSKFGQLVPPPGAAPPGFDLRAASKSLASLYRGVVGAASGAGIAIGAYFAFYGAASNMITRHRPDMKPGSIAFCSGALAAAGSSVIKVPLAVCIRSVQAGIYPNVISAATTIVAKAGPAGLFTGYLPTLLEDVPDMAFKFAAYESMRSLHKKVLCKNGRIASPQEDFAMGAIAGAMAAAATTPLDVVKTNMMCAAASRPTMAAATAAVLAQGGPKAFFAGVGTRAVSNGINSAVFFCFFEAMRTAFALRTAAAAARPALALPAPSSAGNGRRQRRGDLASASHRLELAEAK